MKTKAIQRLRAKLSRNEPVYGLWVTLESATITELAVALGLDWVVIDAEHGHLDWKEINEHIRATLRSDTVVLVRIAERSTSLTKRALDIGADGVVIPWIETVTQLEEAIRDSRYPVQGRRGIGGERATVWGQCFAEHTAEANEHVLVIPLIESIHAVEQVPAMCEVEGTDIFFFGPADFSASAGYRGQWEGPGVAEQLVQLKAKIRAAGKHCGVMTTSIENLLQRREQGFGMLGMGADTGLLLRALHQSLQAVQRDRWPAPSLDPADGREVQLPLSQPPAGSEPDRQEVVTHLGAGHVVELEPGVRLEALAGGFNATRGLTTGIVTMQPESLLNYHTHPCSESITVLEGEVEITVEGRVYRLRPLDNMTIPRWLPHRTRNPQTTGQTRLHVALAMAIPERYPVTRLFPQCEMPDHAQGVAGGERVTRFMQSLSTQKGGAEVQVIDYCHAGVMPGLEMSSGLARFEPGSHLPEHLHAFDESICQIRGEATCLVEGRRYTLSDCATIMIPRGRVHSCSNESKQLIDMIWVCASPFPERILIRSDYTRT